MTPSAAAQQSLGELFASAARAYESRPALWIDSRTWTYGELDERALQIERFIEDKGFHGAGANIAVVCSKCAIVYAAMIAVLRSGNVYVPVNPSLPFDRQRRIVEQAKVSLLIVPPAALESLDQILAGSAPVPVATDGVAEMPSMPVSFKVTDVSGLAQEGRVKRNTRRKPVPPTAPAYLLFTSGSTGVPKGVVVDHDAACACIRKVFALLNTGPDDRFTQFTELSFDMAIAEIFVCWTSGACLYVPGFAEGMVPADFVNRHGLTVWSSVPSLASHLQRLGLLRANRLPSLRWSLFCGEALPESLARDWAAAAPNSTVVNFYGPTECAIFATYHIYEPGRDLDDPVAIGRPLPGIDVLLVDNGKVAGAGAVAELCLSGDQLARGYWEDPKAAADAFCTLPDADPGGKRWYRTGDLASIGPASVLRFHGRADRQIKLNGYRLQLQEVESALRKVSGRNLVAVVPVASENGLVQRILAFVDRLAPSETDLKQALLDHLPRYFIPERIFELGEFPTGAHGKIDYKGLEALAKRSSPGAELHHQALAGPPEAGRAS